MTPSDPSPEVSRQNRNYRTPLPVSWLWALLVIAGVLLSGAVLAHATQRTWLEINHTTINSPKGW